MSPITAEVVSEERNIAQYEIDKYYAVIQKSGKELVNLGEALPDRGISRVRNPNLFCVVAGTGTSNPYKAILHDLETYKGVQENEIIGIAKRVVKRNPGDDIVVLKSTSYKIKNNVIWTPVLLLKQVVLTTVETTEQLPTEAIILTQNAMSLILKEKKTLVISDTEVTGFSPTDKFVIGEDTAVGVVQLSEPRAISMAEFKELQKEHCITDKQRKTNWPRKRKLFAYEITAFLPINDPVPFTKSENPETFIVDIEFRHEDDDEEDEEKRDKKKPYKKRDEDRGFPAADPEGGVHAHALRRSEGKTAIDGAHLHLYRIPAGTEFPDGSVLDEDVDVITKEDGSHGHGLQTDVTANDGEHDHEVIFPDGSTIDTERDGKHSHSMMVFTTGFDAPHTHKLVLPSGVELESMSPADFIEENPALQAVNVPEILTASEILQKDFEGLVKQGRGTQVQTLIFAKDKFPTASAARKWAKDHGFRTDKVDETENSFRLRQRNPGDFVRLRTITLTSGVQAVVGPPKTRKVFKGYERPISLHKAEGPDERTVLGIVLEPETVDSQGDIYSEEEVEKALETFMESYQNFKVMHNGEVINKEISILQTFIAPTDLEINGQQVKKGTWLLKVRVNNDHIWKKVKNGELTGFSIGGYSQAKELV